MARPTSCGDCTVIDQLELLATVGVGDEERERPQRLTVSLCLYPSSDFQDLGDDLGRTIDYSEVCRELKVFVAQRRDKLIETLAEALALYLLERFPIQSVEIELRKFVLPDTKFVAVWMRRDAKREGHK